MQLHYFKFGRMSIWHARTCMWCSQGAWDALHHAMHPSLLSLSVTVLAAPPGNLDRLHPHPHRAHRRRHGPARPVGGCSSQSHAPGVQQRMVMLATNLNFMLCIE